MILCLQLSGHPVTRLSSPPQPLAKEASAAVGELSLAPQGQVGSSTERCGFHILPGKGKFIVFNSRGSMHTFMGMPLCTHTHTLNTDAHKHTYPKRESTQLHTQNTGNKSRRHCKCLPYVRQCSKGSAGVTPFNPHKNLAGRCPCCYQLDFTDEETH